MLWLNYGLWSGSIGPCVAAVLSVDRPTSPPHAAQASLSLPLHYSSLALSTPALPCHLASHGKNEEQDKRKQNKHWPHGSFSACNMYVCTSMRCGRAGEIVYGYQGGRAVFFLRFYTSPPRWPFFLSASCSFSVSYCLSRVTICKCHLTWLWFIFSMMYSSQNPRYSLHSIRWARLTHWVFACHLFPLLKL